MGRRRAALFDFLQDVHDALVRGGQRGRLGERLERLHGSEPQTLEMLSERLGLTRERVRQIQNEALHKLRRHLDRDGISSDILL